MIKRNKGVFSMTEVLKENISDIDGGWCILTQELSDGSRREIRKHDSIISSVKTIDKDGSYIILNADKVKVEELTADGYLRIYNPQTQKLSKEISPEKITKTFHENGNIETLIDEQNNIYESYYENGNLAIHQEKNYEIYKGVSGSINYEFKGDTLTINPDWFSYYRLGTKSINNDIHWEEKVSLNPKKKTLLCLGGDQTKDSAKANGNINAFLGVLGLSTEEKANIQLVSCYRPYNSRLRYIWRMAKGFKQQIENDYKREILQKFIPFMARYNGEKWERLAPKELMENFRNIIIQTHCAGANDLPRFTEIFKQTMTKLGYSKDLQKNALKQIICITNNNQRELTDDLGFTTFHRYSVKDGQFEPEYKTMYSSEYPLFLQDDTKFVAQKGNAAALIETKQNEMIMAFDKILLYASRGEEHNEGFWVTEKLDLTTVGKYQSQLMGEIGKFWYHNDKEVPDVTDLIKKIAKEPHLRNFCNKALLSGKKIKSEKRSTLFNHHILKSEWNKFKSSDTDTPKTGIYKLLSEKYRS